MEEKRRGRFYCNGGSPERRKMVAKFRCDDSLAARFKGWGSFRRSRQT
jgi:hypothetical protein